VIHKKEKNRSTQPGVAWLKPKDTGYWVEPKGGKKEYSGRGKRKKNGRHKTTSTPKLNGLRRTGSKFLSE